jgi:transcriptional regulator with XRE-family HTH domain
MSPGVKGLPDRPTQREAADLLNMSESALSRALSGQALPLAKSVDLLFEMAMTGAEQRRVQLDITRLELDQLYAKAAAEQGGRGGAQYNDGLDSAVRELRALQDEHKQLKGAHGEVRVERDELRQRVARQAANLRLLKRKCAVLRRKNALLAAEINRLEAGSPAISPDKQTAAPLPVPRQPGDRQRSKLDTAAARNVARHAEALYDDGRQADEILTLLRHTADVYSPAETAFLVALLSQKGQDEMARDLLHIYGRDKPDQEVLGAALELLRSGAPDDAEALLRAATQARRPKQAP